MAYKGHAATQSLSFDSTAGLSLRPYDQNQAAFAGDLVTLFIFWELTAITSVFLIYAGRTQSSATVGTRYMVIQVGSGVILLFGMLLWVDAGNSLAFGHAFDIDNWQQIGMFVDPNTREPINAGAWLILLAFGIKAAFPFLHNWLQDSYPAATVTGTVFLSAFTTKLAIYALARGFAGTDMLIPIGVVMTLFPIFFAVIENDLRKVLAYSLNNQLGYMVVGVGVEGSEKEVRQLGGMPGIRMNLDPACSFLSWSKKVHHT